MTSENVESYRAKFYYSAYCAKKACVHPPMNTCLKRYHKNDVHLMRSKRSLLKEKMLYLCTMDCKGHHWDGKKYVCLYNNMIPTDYVLRMKY